MWRISSNCDEAASCIIYYFRIAVVLWKRCSTAGVYTYTRAHINSSSFWMWNRNETLSEATLWLPHIETGTRKDLPNGLTCSLAQMYCMRGVRTKSAWVALHEEIMRKKSQKINSHWNQWVTLALTAAIHWLASCTILQNSSFRSGIIPSEGTWAEKCTWVCHICPFSSQTKDLIAIWSWQMACKITLASGVRNGSSTPTSVWYFNTWNDKLWKFWKNGARRI